MPLRMVCLASYFAMALLKVSTSLEHLAQGQKCAHTLVIERRGGFGPFCF